MLSLIESDENFNSNMVRLRPDPQTTNYIVIRFQFQYGAIKTRAAESRGWL